MSFNLVYRQNYSSFLKHHYQQVIIDNVSSDLVALISGVPQGTVLGPILFIIYMNDVVDNIKHSKIRLFADDIKRSRQKGMHNNYKETCNPYNYGKVLGC